MHRTGVINMSDTIEVQPNGRLGLDVGMAGRWLRLVCGTCLIGFVAFQVIQIYSIGLVIELVLYTIAVLTVYSLAHYYLGEIILNKLNAWVGTTLLLGPLVAIFAFQIGPDVLHQAILLYIGVSLVVSFFMGYGGCEVVSIPSLFFRRRYTVYCPFNLVDAVENVAVGRNSKPS